MRADHPVNSELFARIGHTLPGRVAVFAELMPEHCAIREKWRGLWRETSWREYLQHCLGFGEALKAVGLGAGDRVAIISDNRPEWLYADIGTQAIGALSAGIYTTNPAADVAYVLNHCKAKLIVCEDQEQLDKVLDSPEALPHLQHIVVIDSEGTHRYDDPRLRRWDDFISAGTDAAATLDSAGIQARMAALDADADSVIIYTSGTTGQPKGVLLKPSAMLALSTTYLDELGGSEHDSLLSYLPLCHVAEKIFTEFTPLTTGATVHFGESIDTIRQDIAQVAPTIFLGVPRIWEKLHASVDVAIRNSTPLKRALYHWALAQGRARFEAPAPGLLLRAKAKLADWLVLRALRERLGLGRCRLPVSGAAPIAEELLRWFHWIGVPVLEGYGMSETCGISHLNLPNDFRLGSIGKAVRGVEFRLAEDGELLVRGPHLCSGYLDNEAATRETIDSEGWLHTGDLAREDEDGFLHIIGRKKEILITAGGKNLSPARIENALKTSAYIKEAAAVADGRAFVAALIQIEPDMVGDWAARAGVNYTSFEDLSGKAQVVKLIDGEVRRINEQLARVEQVRAFRLLPKELHQDDGEVTATQKLKRNVVYSKFAGLVDDIYSTAKAS